LLVYHLVLLIPNSYKTVFWEFYFLPSLYMSKQRNLCNLIVYVMVGFLTICSVSKMKLSSNETYCDTLYEYLYIGGQHYLFLKCDLVFMIL
jgi:hypothetical protein